MGHAYGRVYVITNLVNGKKYVGQTTRDISVRFRQHCCPSAHDNMPICAAIKKYGKENFSIEEVVAASCQEDLDMLELSTALTLGTFSPSGYNLKAGLGTGSLSDETKRKIGESNRGKKRSAETIQRLSDAHKGQKQSDDSRAKRSTTLKGTRPSQKAQDNCLMAVTKVWSFVSPDGEAVTFRNLAAFCRENSLSSGCMRHVFYGTLGYSQHKGWTSGI